MPYKINHKQYGHDLYLESKGHEPNPLLDVIKVYDSISINHEVEEKSKARTRRAPEHSGQPQRNRNKHVFESELRIQVSDRKIGEPQERELTTASAVLVH
jgi:hypothetical protein